MTHEATLDKIICCTISEACTKYTYWISEFKNITVCDKVDCLEEQNNELFKLQKFAYKSANTTKGEK